MTQGRDELYTDPTAPKAFVFDERVAACFEDMINRSVPGYATIISMIGVLAQRYCQPGTHVYDLGCSLGAATVAIRQQLDHDDCRIVAVDNSAPMVAGLQERLAALPAAGPPVEVRCADIVSLPLAPASVVVLNFTLQFIPVVEREALLRRIHTALRPGGILILSEKIRFPDPDLDRLFIDMYHRFKARQGYSELEIARKRDALENVLIPETLETHRSRALSVGFQQVDVWFQCFNFASMVAVRAP